MDILKSLFKQQNERFMCDVIIWFENRELFVHSCVLASVSPYFFRFLLRKLKGNEDWSHRFPLKINLKEIRNEQTGKSINCFACVEGVIKFTYTSSIEVDSTHIDHVRDITSVFEIPELTELMDSLNDISTSVSHENEDAALQPTEESDLQNSKNYYNSTGTFTELKSLHKEDSSVLKYDSNYINIAEECSLCSLSENRVFHKKIHHSKSFDCLFCSFQSSKLISLIEHVMAVGNHGEKICSICLHEENNVNAIKSHCQVHLEPQGFVCPHCSARFSKRTAWRLHLQSHALNTEFKCALCALSFSSRLRLRIHLLEAHNKFRHECTICGYSTRFRSVFNRHQLKHINKTLECPEEGCGFRTARAGNLKAHSRVHGEVKARHLCPKCGAGFSLGRNLRRHMRGHESHRHQCPECSHVSVRLDRLRAHCVRVHGAAAAAHLTKQLSRSISPHHTNPVPSAVFLDDATGHLSILCDAQGRPLGGSFSVHSVAGGLSRVTLDPSGEILAVEAADEARGRAAAILDQATGHVALLDLNLARPPPVPEVLLDEATGIITEPQQETEFNSIEFDQGNLDLDVVDFDALNDDSFDGFDDFTFNPDEASSNGEEVLNEVTGELFSSEIVTVDSGSSLWNIDSPLKSNFSSDKEDLSEIFLNEVTGELTLPT